MKSSNRDLFHLLYLIVGTLLGYFLTLWLLGVVFPEHRTVSVRSLFLATIYMVFFFLTVIPLGIGKLLTIKVVMRNLVICFAAPYIFFHLFTLLSALM